MRAPSNLKAASKGAGKTKMPAGFGAPKKTGPKLPTGVAGPPAPPAPAGPPTLASGGPGAPSGSSAPDGPVPPMGFNKGGKVKKSMPFKPFKKGRR